MNHYHLYRLFQQMLEQNHMSERLEAIAQHIGITTEELHAQMLQYEKQPTAARFNARPDSDVYAQFLKRLDTEWELMCKTLPVLGINILPFQYNQFQHQHLSGLKTRRHPLRGVLLTGAARQTKPSQPIEVTR